MKTLALFLSLAVAIASANEVGEARTDGVIRSFELPSAEVTAIVNLVTTFILFAVVSTILMPILSGNVVLVQRRADELTGADDLSDYENSITNDNIDLAGGYYSPYTEEDPYQNNQGNNYYDPYYGYGYNTGYYDTNSASNADSAAGRQLTFGDASFYFGDWVNDAGGIFDRAAKSIKSLDLVDTTFGILNVESKACRERAICQLERAATQNAVLGFLTSNLNSYINGMDKYEGAIYRGRNGQSCEEIYAECTKPVSDTWNLFKRR